MTDLAWRYLTAEDKSAILRGIRDGVAYGGPFHVEIYPADRCNIDCFFCSTAAIRGTDELPLVRIEELMIELKSAGTRAIRLAGGGEPLFHRKTKAMLRQIAATGVPVENLTTNAVILDAETAEILTACCDEVTVSLNTADPVTYSEMMRTPPRNFERVVNNVRNLIAIRRKQNARRPIINLQYLIWRGNFRTIPRMYELARELEVDAITFNGLSHLRPDQEMSDAEHAELLRLYESLIRRDEFRRIRSIASFERDIRGDMNDMIGRLSAERGQASLLMRMARFLRRNDYSLADKLAHRRRVRQNTSADRATASFNEACIMGWYTMVIRSDGAVAPCCILLSKQLGNVFKNSVHEIWHSEAYQQFRSELAAIIADPDGWTPSDRDRTVIDMCGKRGSNPCPMKSFYFIRDVPFVRQLERTFAEVRSASERSAGDAAQASS